jgi:hypothetical protein
LTTGEIGIVLGCPRIKLAGDIAATVPSGELEGFFKKRYGMRGVGSEGGPRRVPRTKTLNMLVVERNLSFFIQIDIYMPEFVDLT